MVLLMSTEVLGGEGLMNKRVAESNPELLQRAMQ